MLADVSGRIDACNLGETVFGITRSQSQMFERSARRIAQDDIDHLLVQVFLEGGGTTSDGHRILAGDMLVIDLNQPHSMINTEFANLTLVLPRNLHADLTDLLSAWHGRALLQGNAMVKFVGQQLVSLWEHMPELDVVQAGAAVHGTLGLMEAWLSRDEGGLEEQSYEVSIALDKAIRSYIRSHLDENMTVGSLAEKFRISRSQIYRKFKSRGGVMHYIWQCRLRRSMRVLSQTLYADQKIGRIAFDCGFTSEAHFSRAFKSHFGVSPSEVRMEALTAQNIAPANPAAGESDYSTRIATWLRQL